MLSGFRGLVAEIDEVLVAGYGGGSRGFVRMGFRPGVVAGELRFTTGWNAEFGVWFLAWEDGCDVEDLLDLFFGCGSVSVALVSTFVLISSCASRDAGE